MKGIKINIIANYLGTFWNIISIYLFIPFYISYLGDEGYGIIMFSVTLQSIILLLDGGFSSAIRRELSWGIKNKDFVERAFSLVKTVEFFYATIFGILFISVIMFSGWISNNWFKIETLTPDDIVWILLLITGNAILQMQSSLYNGSLLALEFQVLSNILQFVYTFSKNGLVILILVFHSDVYYFLLWQCFVTLIYLIFQRFMLFSKLNSIRDNQNTKDTGKIDIKILSEIWKVGSIFLILSIISTVNLQIDKIVISKLLNIRNVGYYNTAYSLGQILVSLSGPIAVALSPLMIQAYSSKDIKSVTKLFHTYAKFTSIISVSLGVTILYFSSTIIYVWTGNQTFTSNAAPLVPYMIVAGVCLSAQIIPYTIGVASAHLNQIIIIGIINIVITVPTYYMMTSAYGLLGTARVWCISNVIMLLLNVLFYLKKSIPQNYKNWLITDVISPSIVVGLIVVLLSTIKPVFHNRYIEIITIGCVFLASFSIGITIFFFSELKEYANKLYYFKKNVRE